MQLSELLPAHLEGHPVHGDKGTAIASRLESLVGGGDNLDASQRKVARGAITYFLATNDAISDDLPDGLEDDETDIIAAERSGSFDWPFASSHNHRKSKRR